MGRAAQGHHPRPHAFGSHPRAAAARTIVGWIALALTAVTPPGPALAQSAVAYEVVAPPSESRALRGDDGVACARSPAGKGSACPRGVTRAYVLGIAHLGRTDIGPLDPCIAAAIDRADAIAVEARTDGAFGERARESLARAALIPPASLAEQLPAALHATLMRALHARGVRADAFEDRKPWLVAIALTADELARYGYRPRYGIDSRLVVHLREAKHIVELEGADLQLAALDALPLEFQQLMLARALDSLPKLPDTVARIEQLLAVGDADGLAELLFADAQGEPAVARLHEAIYHARSEQMADRIAGAIADGRRWVVLVGAGHVVGERGIAARLAARGYGVRRIALGVQAGAAQRPVRTSDPALRAGELGRAPWTLLGEERIATGAVPASVAPAVCD